MPSSTRPPLIWSTWATEIASGPGSRKVAAVISVPSRIRLVSRARPARVTQASVGPGQAVAAHRQVVVGPEEGVEAGLLGAPRDGEQVVVRGAQLGLGEDPQLHGPTLASRRSPRRPARALGVCSPPGPGRMIAETINSEVQLVFRKKTRGQVIGAELQEGFAHIGVAAHEAGRLAAEQLGPRVAAAREAAGPALDAAQKAAVRPKVAAAVAVAAPAVASARDAVVPRVEAARDAMPPLEAARGRGPRVAAAQAAAAKAAADLAPRVEAAQKAAQKALKDDVVPRLEAAQTAALAYATPRVVAAREAVTPALESAKETLAAGVDSARSELDARRAEVVAAAEKSTRKARKRAKKARKTAGQEAQGVREEAARHREDGQAQGRRREGAAALAVGVRRPRRGYGGVRPAAPQEGRRLDARPGR